MATNYHAYAAIAVDEANENAQGEGNRYFFLEELGRGTYGTVLKAQDRKTDEVVAIKIIRAKIKLFAFLFKRKSTPAALEGAQQEKDTLEGLQHENIVAFKGSYEFEWGRRGVGLAIVMQFYANNNLQYYLENLAVQSERVALDIRIKWYRQLSSGLEFIHHKGIVHRDLKPPNILIDDDESLKIADVGLAKALSTDGDWDSAVQHPQKGSSCQQNLTTPVGTPPYMAPEIWKRCYNMSSDVFSMGLIFVMISEVPNPPIPVARWKEENCCVGQCMILLDEESKQEEDATGIIDPEIKYARKEELMLFREMLQYDCNRRCTMTVVGQMVGNMERKLLRSCSAGDLDDTEVDDKKIGNIERKNRWYRLKLLCTCCFRKRGDTEVDEKREPLLAEFPP